MNMSRFLIIFALLASFTANAQLTKGNWLIGGDAYYTNSNAKNENGDVLASSNGFEINPNLGYFLFTGFAAGLRGNTGYNKASGGSSSINFSGGPFTRYYFLNPENRVNLFAEAGYGWGTSISKGNKSSSSRGYSLKAGPVIFLNNIIGLELALNYSSTNMDSTNYNNFQIGLGLQIHLEK